MDDVISREQAIYAVSEALATGKQPIKALEQLPPIHHNIVRCGECKHRYVLGENIRYNVCELNHNSVHSDDWFCADGERKQHEH